MKKKSPRYKLDPKKLFLNAKKNGVLSEKEEKLFVEDPHLAIKYALEVKNNRLSEYVENKIYKYFISQVKDCPAANHPQLLGSLFKYIKAYKSIPEKHKKNLIKYTNPLIINIYAEACDCRLSEKYEKKMFDECMKHEQIWPLVDYQHHFKIKVDYMHNYIVVKSLDENNLSSQKNAITAYFLNLKKLQNILKKLYDFFGDENITLKEVINKI